MCGQEREVNGACRDGMYIPPEAVTHLRTALDARERLLMCRETEEGLGHLVRLLQNLGELRQLCP